MVTRQNATLLVMFGVLLLPSDVVVQAQTPNPPPTLAEALAQEDLSAVRAAVAAGRNALGNKAGEPEVADIYRPVPSEASLLTPAEVHRGFTPYFDRLESMRWWKVGVDPRKDRQEQFRRQADSYRRVFEVCLDNPGMKGIKLWGVVDDRDWKTKQEFHPYLFDGQGRAKPAFFAVQKALADYRPKATR